MLLYASKCPVCGNVEFKPMGSAICSKCGIEMFQSKIEKKSYEIMPEASKALVFFGMKEKSVIKERKKLQEDALRDDNFIIVTTDFIDGYEIDKYYGLVVGQGLTSLSPLKYNFETPIQPALNDAILSLKKNAAGMYPTPDAVIGIKTNIISGDWGYGVFLTGTAVTLKKKE